MTEQVVVVKSRTPVINTLGIIGIVFGALALAGSWIPLLGVLTLPVAILGGALSAIGLLLSLLRGFRGWGLPFLGLALCVAAGVIATVNAKASGDALEELEKPRNEASKALQEEEQREQELYIKNSVTLYDVSSRMYTSILEEQEPGVKFKLKNTGDRTLTEVEVTFYFLDSTGAVIAEESFYPVLATGFSRSNRKPLKPGYVWQQEEGKFYAADKVPSEWKVGSVRAAITDIRFEDKKD